MTYAVTILLIVGLSLIGFSYGYHRYLFAKYEHHTGGHDEFRRAQRIGEAGFLACALCLLLVLGNGLWVLFF